jgi:hypothetical protein
MFNLFSSASKGLPAANKGEPPLTPSDCSNNSEDSPPLGRALRSLDMSLRKLEANF